MAAVDSATVTSRISIPAGNKDSVLETKQVSWRWFWSYRPNVTRFSGVALPAYVVMICGLFLFGDAPGYLSLTLLP